MITASHCFSRDNRPKTELLLITGIFTFPDYLKGKTFADFL